VGQYVLNQTGGRALWGAGRMRRGGKAGRSPALIKREPRLNKCGASREGRQGEVVLNFECLVFS